MPALNGKARSIRLPKLSIGAFSTSIDADVKATVDFTVDKFGRLDVAFNNAGVEWKGPLDQATEAEYRRVFDINVWGVLNSMRHEIPAMLKNGGGAIVNNSSLPG